LHDSILSKNGVNLDEIFDIQLSVLCFMSLKRGLLGLFVPFLPLGREFTIAVLSIHTVPSVSLFEFYLLSTVPTIHIYCFERNHKRNRVWLVENLALFVSFFLYRYVVRQLSCHSVVDSYPVGYETFCQICFNHSEWKYIFFIFNFDYLFKML